MSFCTIITADYIHYALALRDSVLKFRKDLNFYIFISESENPLFREYVERNFDQTYLIFCEDLNVLQRGRLIYEKYYNLNVDKYRWSMKPVLIEYLISVKSESYILYADCDIRFYGDYSFLFEELKSSSILLSPHFRSSNPVIDENNFIQLYTYGLFNGGFIGVSSKGLEAMKWWADVNYFICEIDRCKGQYVDQAHLNLLPIYFDDVYIIKHRGCNVAGWNLPECKRTQIGSEVKINGIWPIIFVHFSESTSYFIRNGEDPLLIPYLSEYQNNVAEYEQIKKHVLSISGYSDRQTKTRITVNNSISSKLKRRISRILKNILLKIDDKGSAN